MGRVGFADKDVLTVPRLLWSFIGLGMKQKSLWGPMYLVSCNVAKASRGALICFDLSLVRVRHTIEVTPAMEMLNIVMLH